MAIPIPTSSLHITAIMVSGLIRRLGCMITASGTYKPDINRWTSIDPIRSGNNWYAYVGNDPVNWVDPLGLLPEVPGDGTVFEPDDGLSVAEKDLAASRELARLETLYSELEEADKDFGEAAVGMFVVAQYDRAFDQSIVSTNFAEELREQLISNQRRGEKIRSEINRIFDNSIYKA